MYTSVKRQERSAFTLVELLVVIAIIAILVSLLSAGIYSAMNHASDAQNATEIGQLGTALGSFKTKFGMYPPSHIRLVESGNLWTNTSSLPPSPNDVYDVALLPNGHPRNPLDYYSVANLKAMWPRIAFNPPAGTYFDWNYNGSVDTGIAGSFILYGDQCLVFFLGGMQSGAPNPPGTVGFSNSPTNPTLPPTATNQQRIGPFYEFQSNRLVSGLMGAPADQWHPRKPFYSYLDVYGRLNDPMSKPFAYFASHRGLKNQYNPADCTDPIAGTLALPYAAPPVAPPATFTSYWNPETFQIISAGADQCFGSLPDVTFNPKGAPVVWDPSGASSALISPSVRPTLPNGRLATNPALDDRTNFCPNILGAGNN